MLWQTGGQQVKKGGSVAYAQKDHVGVYYDLAMASLASYAGDVAQVYNYTQLARGRLFEQLDTQGLLGTSTTAACL